MSNQAFKVKGGNKLSGEITPQGAKNEALQIISACLLTSEEVILENVPNIIDIRKLIGLLKGLGVKVKSLSEHSYSLKADSIDLQYYASPEYQGDARRIRGSVMLLGPLLARFKKAFIPKPGGDKIGRRRLDTHFNGFIKLGAEFRFDEAEDHYYLEGQHLKGDYILMEEISVTGTANIVMAAVLTPGKTTIYNAACEPYLQQLCKMLVRMGAKIDGIGSNLLHIEEYNNRLYNNLGINYRLGTDFFVHKHHTIGFLVSGNNNDGGNTSNNSVKVSNLNSPTLIDSVLIADNTMDKTNQSNTFNLNYVFDNKKHTLNFDADYGRYRNNNEYFQPNRYYDAQEEILYSEVLTAYDTPVEIDIKTAKLDYETSLFGGQLGIGAKVSKVETDNTFYFYDIQDSKRVLNDQRSNQFIYDELVYAEYVSYARSITEKLNFSAGLRVETTDVKGDLTAFDPSLQEPPVEFNYTNYFPSAGLTYQLSRMKTLSLNYGRRINRPDYNVLNPFRVQLSELSFSKGNAFLRPEIVNNIELGFTLNYRYNFKLSYSKTTDQITRLIGPDDADPRAGYITWENLAEQKVIGFNISAPFSVTSWWNAFFNFNTGYLDNQADYGEGAVVDIQAFTYSIYQQQTINLPKDFVAEISGYFSGPGVWGGVFKYESSWSLNLGLQKKFLNDQLNVKLAANDLFHTTGWSGTSIFDGLEGEGNGKWDSQRISLSLAYNFGNNNVKSRKRKTSIEEENARVKSD